MEHETNRRFEAWLDDERCVISFHSFSLKSLKFP